MSLLSNQSITIILVAVSYILGSTLLLALSNLWFIELQYIVLYCIIINKIKDKQYNGRKW